ncbi:DUF2971 domain-containing protein [Candidatus Poriferisodalis sp.]|uniref:DUF2971 domain-containing protein n=1 Tax=Candidatus Poriferisodalis sp. TaxID=3101277 RepID=UPI003B0223DE
MTNTVRIGGGDAILVTEVYRFRSASRLLDEAPQCQELERQMIYFAAPAELNDPVEAMRGLSWRGDRIAWTNLFKNYVFCVHRAYLDCMIGGPEVDLENRGLWVEGRWDEPETPQMGELFDEIWTQVRSDYGVGDFAEQLGALERPVRRHEMLVYLYGVHSRALASTAAAYAEQGLGPEPVRALQPQILGKPMFPVAEVEGLASQIADGKQAHELLHETLIEMLATRFLIQRYVDRRDSGEPIGVAKRQLAYELPRMYLSQLPELMGPAWHAASFCNTYRSPAMWANYAANHTGACLVFETETTDQGRLILLHSEMEARTHADCNERIRRREFRFRDVDYADRLPEVDFFRNLGRLPELAAMKLWYSDDTGNVSSCASFLQDRNLLDAWREEHWDGYYRAVFTKTKHWEYEEESRLLQYGLELGSSDHDPRLMRYDFGSLKGIIFGINTHDHDKIAIIDLIKQKCTAAGRTDFDFRQAHYSWRTGQIESYPLNLDVTR